MFANKPTKHVEMLEIRFAYRSEFESPLKVAEQTGRTTAHTIEMECLPQSYENLETLRMRLAFHIDFAFSLQVRGRPDGRLPT
jgi:hypothetical protein